MDLRKLTSQQIVRVYDTAYRRMTRGNGYQPFGYDWSTIWAVRSGFAEILQACRIEMLRRLHG